MSTPEAVGRVRAPGHASFVARLLAALGWRRCGVVALVAVLLSLNALNNPALLHFFSPAEAAWAWLEHLLELGVVAAALLVVYAVLEALLPRRLALRPVVDCALLLAGSAALALLLHAYYANGFEHLPPPSRVLADSLRWGLPAVFMALIADLNWRAEQTDAAARGAELARAQLKQAEAEQQLAMLQAQIGPHFLFNVLGNVRRLYRTRPQAGAEAIDSLAHYLRTALPQLRSPRVTFGEEVALVRAYLDLFQLRMGAKLRFSITMDPALHDAEFPPMLLVTLVENAIKHGLDPAGGGKIEVRGRRRRGLLETTVLDDGVGFATAASCGTGVGLVNIRRQLAARYQSQARLILEGREPRGARASILIPLRRMPAAAVSTLESLPA